MVPGGDGNGGPLPCVRVHHEELRSQEDKKNEIDMRMIWEIAQNAE